MSTQARTVHAVRRSTPPASKLDPMSFKTTASNLTNEQDQQVRADLLELALLKFGEMSLLDIQMTLRYADIQHRTRGCDTPAEEFISSLVTTHTSLGLGPEDVTREFEEFERNFNDMVQATRHFRAKYPKLM